MQHKGQITQLIFLKGFLIAAYDNLEVWVRNRQAFVPETNFIRKPNASPDQDAALVPLIV